MYQWYRRALVLACYVVGLPISTVPVLSIEARHGVPYM